MIVLLLAIAIPNFMRAREKSRAGACVSNLKQMQTAKEQWAMDTKPRRTPPTPTLADDLMPNYLKTQPACPTAGIYDVGDMSTPPSCTVDDNGTVETYDDHVLP